MKETDNSLGHNDIVHVTAYHDPRLPIVVVQCSTVMPRDRQTPRERTSLTSELNMEYREEAHSARCSETGVTAFPNLLDQGALMRRGEGAFARAARFEGRAIIGTPPRRVAEWLGDIHWHGRRSAARKGEPLWCATYTALAARTARCAQRASFSGRGKTLDI